ncbi:winged helix-turn-helix transcriptional regulator [Undibacterium sp. JH2W]|uniref:winged helix-turn-helix transcriptional regulator n=1 Tax=Undibacterium sp. JH2W TaxID=3413037 RepID=UPI003BF3E6F0
MERSSFSDFSCSIARTLEVIGEWWTLLILRDLFLGFERFDDIQRNLGVASNILTARLKKMMEQGIVERKSDTQDKRVWRYSLTQQGRDLYPVLLALTAWGDKWRTAEGQQPLLIRHQQCGHITSVIPACVVCKEELKLDDLQYEPGPGGQETAGTALMGQVLSRRR